MSDYERRGVWYAVACYTLWGLLPIYWKFLHAASPIAILTNRMVWSFVFVAIVLAVRREWAWVRPALRDRQTVLTYLAAAVLLSVNWYIYIWAVNAGFVVESSLGYFITPLVNVLLGTLFFRERLRLGQWGAIGLAALGVVYLTVTYGQLPWISLALAFTFGFYGLLKKKAKLPALQGMGMEMGLLFLPAAVFLIWQESHGQGSIGHLDWTVNVALLATGVLTVMPLLWFAEAARRIPMTLLGVFQYIAPTIQFVIGIAIYHEPFSAAKLVGFCIIWSALLLYWAEGMLHRQRRPVAAQV